MSSCKGRPCDGNAGWPVRNEEEDEDEDEEAIQIPFKRDINRISYDPGGTVWRRVGEPVGVGPKGNIGVNGVSTADAGADADVEELLAGNKLDELVDVGAEERPVGNEPDEPVDVGAGADVVPIGIPASAAADGDPANPAVEAAAG
eukprot:g21814.t1